MSISNRAAPRSKGTCARTLRTAFWDKRRLNFELIKSLTCKVVIFTVYARSYEHFPTPEQLI